MMVVERELVLDLTEETSDYKEVLKQAINTVLDKEILEFTLVSHLSRRFWVRDLTQILKQTTNLEVLSLFSIALAGTMKEFAEFAQALKRHQELKEVHMVDCGMLGNPLLRSDESNSTAARSTQPKKQQQQSRLVRKDSSKSRSSRNDASASEDSKPPAAAKSKPGPRSKSPKTLQEVDSCAKTASMTNSAAASVQGASVAASSKQGSDATNPSEQTTPGEKVSPQLDMILDALSSIKTLENVEIYGIPADKFDKSSDGDQESGHQAIQEEGEGDRDIPMVRMGDEKDSLNFSEHDYLADYDEDIRGIPGHGRRACSFSKKLSMMMSPESLGQVCKGPNLTNLGLEDVTFKLRHVQLLAEAFSAEYHKIRELKLYGCNIDDEGAHALARMLKVNKTLEKLDLSYNHIGEDGCIAIAVALRGNENLHTLNLMGNECAETYDVASEGGCYEALLDLLEKNKTLKDLILEPFEQDDTSDCVPEFIIVPNNKSPEEVSSASDED